MKAVILSLKPEWWEKMLSGEKTLEIRKSAPHCPAPTEAWPLLVLVYVSGTGAVQGQFTCPCCIKNDPCVLLARQSCVPESDLRKYAGGKSLCGWIVKEVQKYDAPRPLAEFGLARPPMSWQYIEIPDRAEGK